MDASNGIELGVRRWSAWAPGLDDPGSWHQWARGERAIDGPVRPQVGFVAPLQRRRLSEVSRMAFKVARDCLDDDEPGRSFIFCSRYGEYPRSFEILNDLARQEPVSPTAFSMSVHNTAASQFSIHRQDTSPFTAVAAGEATLETAFLEASCQLFEQAVSSVLVVYHDQPLPTLYRGQTTTVTTSMALGLLLCRPTPGGPDIILRLAWTPSHGDAGPAFGSANPVLAVVRLLLLGGAPVAQETGRLRWTWSRPGATR